MGRRGQLSLRLRPRALRRRCRRRGRAGARGRHTARGRCARVAARARRGGRGRGRPSSGWAAPGRR
eukprot:1156423-Prymnesium_polylepis.1